MMKKYILLIIATLLIISCRQKAVGQFLSNSFTILPVGTSLTQLNANKKAFNGTSPGDDHIRSVVKRQRWTSHSSYFFTLTLSDAMISGQNQNHTETMTATQLLNHFFGGLNNFGFRNMGSESVLTENTIQYTSNTWFKEPGSNISIFGSVYVDIENKTALIDLKISEYYEQVRKN